MTPRLHTILVTGGAGYIGSHCVKRLLENDYRVVVLDDLSTGFRNFVLSEDFIQGHTTDAALLDRLFATYDFDAVMHFAANAYVGESVVNPAKYYRNNITGTLSLLDAMRRNGVLKFIFSSSCAVYGTPERLPITEKLTMSPINPYGFTKRVIEEALKDYSTAYNFRYVSLRYFNAAGADPDGRLGEVHDPETHLIPLILQTATGRRDAIRIFGSDYETRDGSCVRDYVHILDIAKAHLLSAQYLSDGGKSNFFNIGNEQGYTVREVIDACRRISGRDIPVIEDDRRPGDPASLVASAEKIRTELGWTADFPDLDSMISTAWNWERRKFLVDDSVSKKGSKSTKS